MPQTITAASVAANIRTAVTERARGYRQARTEAASTLSKLAFFEPMPTLRTKALTQER